jgi:predicted RNA-binding Zn-ribbon protein involved in translation (DUF1610 family)
MRLNTRAIQWTIGICIVLWIALSLSRGEGHELKHFGVQCAFVGAAVAIERVIQKRNRTRNEALAKKPCPHCGYFLIGNTSGTCPECGRPFLLVCPACHEQVAADALHCDKCGCEWDAPAHAEARTEN